MLIQVRMTSKKQFTIWIEFKDKCVSLHCCIEQDGQQTGLLTFIANLFVEMATEEE